MARNEIFRDADHLSLPVPAGTASGDPVKVGSLVGVAETAVGDGGNADGHATVWTKGAHLLTVDEAVANIGDPVYITDAGALVSAGTGNTLFGYALETKAAAAAAIRVRVARV